MTYPTFQDLLNSTSTEQLDPYTHNVLSVLSQASYADIIDGLNWYNDAKLYAESLSGWLKVLHPQDTTAQLTQRAAGIIAVLSPRQNWYNNKRYALAVAKMHVFGIADLLDILPVFEANRIKACALASEPWSEDLITSYVKGPKVTAFYKNILGDSTQLTLDTHAINIARGVYEPNPKQPKRDERDRIELGYVQSQALFSYWLTSRYPMLSNLDRYPTLSQIQAIAWVAWRRLHHGHNHNLG